MPGLLEQPGESPFLIADGAWGSAFIAQGLDLDREPAEAWNLRHGGRVAELARHYARSADLLTTNTFGANRIRLARFGLEHQLRTINTRGVEIARRAGNRRKADGGPLLIGGAIGPVRGVGAGTPGDAAVAAVYEEQAACLLEAGADFVVVETMCEPAEAAIAIRAARAAGARSVVCTFAFRETTPGTFATWSGASVELALMTAMEAGADITGANCVPASPSLLTLITEMRACAGADPLWLKPNAGEPVKTGPEAVAGHAPRRTVLSCLRRFWQPECPAPLWHYPHPLTDEGFIVRILDALGRGVIGGCCGTTPSDITRIRRVLTHRAGEPV